MITQAEPTTTPSLGDIEALTKKFSDAHGALSAAVRALREAQEHIARERMPAIKKLLATAAERKATLKAAVESAPALFDRPRTVVFHGVKVGMQKGKGGITWDDEAKVVERIKRIFLGEASALLRIEETPDKEAIAKLNAGDLRRIGCQIESAGDQVVIRPTDSEVEQIAKLESARAGLQSLILNGSAETALGQNPPPRSEPAKARTMTKRSPATKPRQMSRQAKIRGNGVAAACHQVFEQWGVGREFTCSDLTDAVAIARPDLKKQYADLLASKVAVAIIGAVDRTIMRLSAGRGARFKVNRLLAPTGSQTEQEYRKLRDSMKLPDPVE